jgi:serine/threonine-protein kinase
LNGDAELERFGLDGDEWLELLRDAEAPADLGALGPYRLSREVGRGGQAVVYEAVRETDGRRVAVKRLLAGRFAGPAALQRFEREIEAVSLLSHPAVVRAEGVQVLDGQPVLVMEWIEGERVSDWAASRGRREILGVVRKIAAAVAHAHRYGVIHRDLKPENVLISADGEPHVLDFGLAKWTEAARQDGAPVTRTSQFLGTPAYCSPEQIGDDPRGVDARTDVYSLGVIAYRLLLGRLPYEVEGGLRRMLDSIASAEPRRPRDVDPRFDRDLEAVLLRMLAKDRERRYASMDLLLADLDRLERGEPVEAQGLHGGALFRRFVRRHRVAVAVASAFVLLVAGFGATMTVLYRRAETEAERVRQVEDFLASMLAPQGFVPGEQSLTLVDVLRRASRRLEEGEVRDPQVLSRLHLRLNRNYAAIWKWPEAERHAAAALELFRRLGDGQGTIDALIALGLAETFLERPEAVGRQREAMAMVEAMFGPESPEAGRSLSLLAFALYRAAEPPDVAQSEACYERALRVLANPDEPSPMLAGTWYGYAVLAVEQGDPETAAERYRRALAIYETLPQSLAVTGVRCMEDYAKTLAALGRADEAHAWLARSREGRALDAATCEASAVLGMILAGGGHGDAAAPFLLESLALTCDYVSARRPEHAPELLRAREALQSGRFPADALGSVGLRARDLDASLHDNWTEVLRTLAEIYEPAAPDRARTCRTVLSRFPAASGSPTM